MSKVHSSGRKNTFLRSSLCVLSATIPFLLAGCPSDTPPLVQPAQATAPAIAPQQGKPAAATAPTVDQKKQQALKEQQLIDRVDKSYQSGVANYRAGRLDAARLDFDFAVDAMLTSGLDLKSDGPLADEFERIVSAVNSLEMDSLKQGNGFSVPVEESPVEAAGELTFGHDASLTAKVSAELSTTKSDLPLVVNDYVTGYINYFTNNQTGHAHLIRSLERAGKYQDMIKRILRQEGVPEDMIYLAVAESGFQPQALNAKSGAGGMWQFMPFRGAYGLERNGWFDERFDPEKSSRAYARYIKSLYDQFGDWYLAMAAYNWGPGNIQKEVMRTGYADFWTLYRLNALPKETKNYVPAMLAAVIMAKNPQQYGLTNVQPEPAVVSDTVTTSYAIDLRLVADITNTSVSTIVGLNPSLLRMQTPRDLNFDLHIPQGTKDLFQKRVAEIPEDKRDTWRFHIVAAGETLDQLAQTYHVKSHDLATTNDLKDTDQIEAGDELYIPINVTATATSRPQRYTVKRGDTLVTIADHFGVSTDDLRRWNHLSSTSIAAGHTLLVAEPVRLAPSTRVRSRRSHSSSAHDASSSSGKSKKTSTTHSGTSKASSRPAAHASSGKSKKKK